jgi:hypothetical protein
VIGAIGVAVFLLVVVVGVVVERRPHHGSRHERCLRNIAALERELGIGPPVVYDLLTEIVPTPGKPGWYHTEVSQGPPAAPGLDPKAAAANRKWREARAREIGRRRRGPEC